MPVDLVTLVGADTLPRLIIPSSFVATIDRRSLATPVEFRIGTGGWIVQAKANIRANSPERVEVQLALTAKAETTVEDRAKVSVDNLGYATVVAILGFHVSTHARVEIALSEQGLQSADIGGIVITAIRQDDLIVLAM
jgi:hypothetical protein